MIISNGKTLSEFTINDSSGNLINNIKDDVLYVKDVVINDVNSYTFVYESINKKWKTWCNVMFIEKCGGYNNSETQELTARRKTCSNWLLALRRIGVWATQHAPDLPITQWQESHCRQLLQDALTNQITITENERYKHKLPLISHGVLDEIFGMLLFSHKLYHQGKLSEGLTISFSKRFREDSLGEILKERKTSYEEWMEGGYFESIPLPIAMMLLSDAISILRSDQTKLLLAYFRHQRTNLAIHPKSLFHNKRFDVFCKNGTLGKSTFTPNYRTLHEVLKVVTGKPVRHIPFSPEIINDHCASVFDACIVIVLTLTGIRISELGSICADDYKLETDGTWVFNSDLFKTNFGLPEIRTMSGLVAEAAETMVGLSYLTKRKRVDCKKLPLFSRNYYISNYRRDNRIEDVKFKGHKTGTLSDRLNVFYSKFLDNHNEVKSECPLIHPHRFRHTFAEFGLRRFDGNVLEAIRQHFRHQAGSYFTHRYMDNKLSAEVKDEIERDYLKELISRIVESENNDLSGPVAVYIKKKAKEQCYLQYEEVAGFVVELADEFEKLVAHEYGFCMVRTETRHLSKCYDKKTQVPMIQNGCFSICSGCPNSLYSTRGNKEEIIRIATSHQNMIDNFPIKVDGITAIESSKAVVKRAGQILDEMELEA